MLLRTMQSRNRAALQGQAGGVPCEPAGTHCEPLWGGPIFFTLSNELHVSFLSLGLPHPQSSPFDLESIIGKLKPPQVQIHL